MIKFLKLLFCKNISGSYDTDWDMEDYYENQ